MNCPYCNNEMVKGVIQGDGRSSFKWVENEERDRIKGMGLMDRMAVAFDGKNIIAKAGGFYKTTKEGYKCNICNKIIIDLE